MCVKVKGAGAGTRPPDFRPRLRCRLLAARPQCPSLGNGGGARWWYLLRGRRQDDTVSQRNGREESLAHGVAPRTDVNVSFSELITLSSVL